MTVIEQLVDACRIARDVLNVNCDCNEPEDKDDAFQTCFEAVVRYEQSINDCEQCSKNGSTICGNDTEYRRCFEQLQ